MLLNLHSAQNYLRFPSFVSQIRDSDYNEKQGTEHKNIKKTRKMREKMNKSQFRNYLPFTIHCHPQVQRWVPNDVNNVNPHVSNEPFDLFDMRADKIVHRHLLISAELGVEWKVLTFE